MTAVKTSTEELKSNSNYYLDHSSPTVNQAMNTEYELTTINDEYLSYFNSCQLVLGDHPQDNHLEIVTVEGDHLQVAVSERGWSLKNKNTSPPAYETFELLAMTHLRAFQSNFNKLLFARLSLLQEIDS